MEEEQWAIEITLNQMFGPSHPWILNVGPRFAQSLRERLYGDGGSIESQTMFALIMSKSYGFDSWRQTTVSKVLSGEREVKLAEAVAIADILKLDLLKMIGASDGEHSEKA